MKEKAKAIQKSYATNTWLLNKLTEDLSHEESVLQLPFPANCLNWMLGHILARRHTALVLLEAGPLWDEATVALYRSGSEPITPDSDARRLDDLRADLEDSQQRLTAVLEEPTEETAVILAREKTTDRGTRPVWQHLQGLHWHETFHMGQVEILRDFALARRE